MTARRVLLLGGRFGSYAWLKALRPHAEVIRVCEAAGVPNECGASALADGTATVSRWFPAWSTGQVGPSGAELWVVAELIEAATAMSATHVAALREDLVLPLSRHHARFAEQGITLCVPTDSAVAAIHDKFALHRHALTYGVGVPAMRTVREPAEALATAGDELGYPVIVRSDTSAGSSGVRYVDNAGALATVVADWLAEGRRVALSAYVEGGVEPSGVLVIDRDGRVLAETWLRKIRYASASRSCCVVTTAPPPGVERIRDLLVGVGFFGMAGIQLKRDRRTGRCVLVEINGRPGQNSKILLELWRRAGADPGEIFLGAFEQPAARPGFTAPVGLVGVSVPEDVIALFRALAPTARGVARPDNPPPTPLAILRSFVDSYVRHRYTLDSVSRSLVGDVRFFAKAMPALVGRLVTEPFGLVPWGDVNLLSGAGEHG
jgi:glutathione synthase/RimK-type ligase-like ATP-grasp enzyme